MQRLFMESPRKVRGEGSRKVIALDIRRTRNREPEALAAYAEEISLARGGDARLYRAAGALIDRLQAAPIESDARAIAERLALLFQGALLVRHSPPAVADAFCATRLKGEGGRSFGILPETADIAAILARQTGALQDSGIRSEEHTSELQSLMRISYAGFCLHKK